MKQMEKDLEALLNEKDTLQKENKKLESKCQQTDELLGVIQILKTENNKYKEDLKRKQDNVSSEINQISLDSCLPCDSKGKEKKLSDGNTAIPDLSDVNRAIKLGERYQELYDNEWTDAMEKLGGFEVDERKSVQKLLDILKKCYKTCEDISDKQMKLLQITLVDPLDSGRPKHGWVEASNPKIPRSIYKQLKEFRKGVSSYAVDKIYKEHASDKFWFEVKTVPNFVQKCIELCWLMCIQDLPLAIGKDATEGVTFDTSMYKPYTNSGTVVSYNVWPPLLLHENGPLLVKGVVQPQKVERKNKIERGDLNGMKATAAAKQRTDVYRSSARDHVTSRNTSGQDQDNQSTRPSTNYTQQSVCPYTGHKLIQSDGVTYIQLGGNHYDYDEYKRLILKKEESYA